MIPINGLFPIAGAIKVHPNDTNVNGYNYYKLKYLVTRAELQTLMAGNLLNPHAVYTIRDAVSSTLVIGVFADTTSTIHSGAYQFTTVPNSSGIYDIALDTWTDCCGGGGGSGTVTSVALTVPAPSNPAFSVSGSPVTTSGTLAISANGTTSQYVRGDGSLATFPTIANGNVYKGSATQVSAGVYTSTITGVAAYVAGDTFIIKFDSVNDGASTLNINSLGAINIYKNTTTPLSSGDIKTNQEITIVYDGTNFQCIGLIPTQLLAYVHNAEGSTINKGQVVYAYQATGNKMSVKLAKANSDATSAKTIGMVYDTSIANGAEGYIIIQGVIEGIDTSMYSAGDTLYLSGTTFGGTTATKPYAPTHLVYVGIVERSNAGNGQIYVRCQNGYELDEIHDVDLITTPPVNGDVLTYNGSLWVDKSISTILGYTPLSNSLTSANIFVGNGSNVATGVAMSGDATIANTGAVTVAKINGATLGTTTATDKNILIANGTQWVSQAMSGDVTIGNTGVTAIGNLKVTNAMLAGSIDLTSKVTGALPIANGGTNATTAYNARVNIGSLNIIDGYQGLGSVVTAQPYEVSRITQGIALASQALGWIYIGNNISGTVTGVKWYQFAKGNYTANNNNKIGLYSYSGGTLTLEASCANDGNLWQTANSTSYGSKAFSATYTAVAGTAYFIARLYCSSAATTNPSLGAQPTVTNAVANTLDFTNGACLFASLTGQTDLPATQAISSTSAGANIQWFGLY